MKPASAATNDFPEELIESVVEKLLRFNPKAIETVRKVGRVSIKQRVEFDTAKK